MTCQAGEFSFCVLSRFASLAARGSVAKTPYFPKTISCPAAIIGETGDSGLSLGLGEMAKLRGLSRFYERLVGQSGGELTDSRLGLIIGDSLSGSASRHEGRGAGKKTTPGGQEENAYFERDS